jgi:hypothetical protein
MFTGAFRGHPLPHHALPRLWGRVRSAVQNGEPIFPTAAAAHHSHLRVAMHRYAVSHECWHVRAKTLLWAIDRDFPSGLQLLTALFLLYSGVYWGRVKVLTVVDYFCGVD